MSSVTGYAKMSNSTLHYSHHNNHSRKHDDDANYDHDGRLAISSGVAAHEFGDNDSPETTGCWRQTISYHLKCDAEKEACRCIATSSTMSSLSCSIRNGPANPKVTLAGACGCHHQVLRQCLFTLRGCSAFSSLTGHAIDLVVQ